jgi:hypothetical protein
MTLSTFQGNVVVFNQLVLIAAFQRCLIPCNGATFKSNTQKSPRNVTSVPSCLQRRVLGLVCFCANSFFLLATYHKVLVWCSKHKVMMLHSKEEKNKAW